MTQFALIRLIKRHLKISKVAKYKTLKNVSAKSLLSNMSIKTLHSSKMVTRSLDFSYPILKHLIVEDISGGFMKTARTMIYKKLKSAALVNQ